MVVVVIVGVLAAVGITIFRKHIFSSRSVEALSMVQSIRAAQERWRAEHFGYLDVSATMDATYPMANPGKSLYAWDQPAGADYQRWRLLAPTTTAPVQFGYTVKAGPPFAAIVAPTNAGAKPVFPAAANVVEPWYIIQSVGDTDADGSRAYYIATSLNGEIYRENEGE
jgi:Tfp pilus assembly protein PilE